MRRSLFLMPLLCHAALFLWAARAWIRGPFEGRGVIDGAEMLELARTGSAGAFETKSPLYPWVLGHLLEVFGDGAWTVALAGLATSLALLAVIMALGARLAGPRAGLVAGTLYAASGSALAFGVQPLDTLLATLLLAGGAWLAEGGERQGRSFVGGALLGAAPFARSTLVLAVLPLLVRATWRRSPAAAGIVVTAALLGLGFGASSIPEGGALNVRLGNDPARPGFTDLRGGPRYDRLRWEAVFEQPDTEPLGSTSSWQLRLLGRAIAADRRIRSASGRTSHARRTPRCTAPRSWPRPLVASESVDLVLSNCVLSLVEDGYKERLFAEIHRVLARGGRCAISDIVSDEDEDLHWSR